MLRHTHMIDSLVVPVRVDLGELGGDPVVLAHHEEVHHAQHRLLVHPAQHRSLNFTYELSRFMLFIEPESTCYILYSAESDDHIID